MNGSKAKQLTITRALFYASSKTIVLKLLREQIVHYDHHCKIYLVLVQYYF